jgi:DNA-binding PadR family transcriptional regulator
MHEERHWHWQRHLMGPGSHRGGRFGARDAWDFFGGPPPRADRGAVRYLVLDAIEKQPRHGYEIMAAIEERSGRTYRPSPGVIYPTLQLLEELGHARVEEHDGRKTYAITPDGKRDLEEHREEVDEFYDRSGAGSWEEYAEELGDLIKHATRLFKVFRHSARRGRLTPTTMKKVRTVLDEALAKIEALVDDGRS